MKERNNKFAISLILLIVPVLLNIACNNQSITLENRLKQKNPKLTQVVIVYIKLSDDGFGQPEEREDLYRLEDKLEPLLNSSSIGKIDGHEFGGGYGVIYIYGENADKLFDVVIQTIRDFKPKQGSFIIKRYGNIEAKEERINL